MKYRVVFVRYDEAGKPYDAREEGDFEIRDGKVWSTSGALDDLVKPGESFEEVQLKLKPPYFRIEAAQDRR